MKFSTTVKWTVIFMVLYCGFYADQNSSEAAEHSPSASTSLKKSPGYKTVQRECTVCHSEKLITQNRASRAGWTEIIRWMQKTQNLRSFSAKEEKTLLDYLANHYGPQVTGRRAPLKTQEWYDLK